MKHTYRQEQTISIQPNSYNAHLCVDDMVRLLPKDSTAPRHLCPTEPGHNSRVQGHSICHWYWYLEIFCTILIRIYFQHPSPTHIIKAIYLLRNFSSGSANSTATCAYNNCHNYHSGAPGFTRTPVPPASLSSGVMFLLLKS